ncbi:3'-5' exoribonuclease HELZ2 [Discoglossus pictus]
MSLLHVALLKSGPGATFSLLAPSLPSFCHYAQGSIFKADSRSHQFDVRVQVVGSVFGMFEQWLVLDFGIRPVLVRKIFLQVGGPDKDATPHSTPSEGESTLTPTSERWCTGKQLIIPYICKTEHEERLLACYKPPQNISLQEAADKYPLTVQNYRQHLHMALLQEEAARGKIISRLNLSVDATLSKMVTTSQGMTVATEGELLSEVPLPSWVTPDTEEGYLLHRSVSTALIAPCPLPANKVYEVSVDASNGSESSVILQIPDRCCQELALKDGSSTHLQVQFQLNRLQFCKYHEAVDRLLDEKLVLPDLPKCHLPTNQTLPSWGNPKQRLAAAYITAPAGEPVPPLLIYGPFGTGKTYTMAKAALEVIKQPGVRVLICTHNNSAADLYIREYFHTYVMYGHPEAIPLRVKYSGSPLNRTDPTTLQYCHLNTDKSSFCNPPRSTLDRHRIIVTTAETSHDLDVPRGYFSHILLDEAAQMLESEALIPLALANHSTRVIMAGDHMQETPKLFCQGDSSGVEPTLLTRLFSHYQGKDCPVAKGGRVIFHQNYRSAPAIISFVSRHFYVGRGDAIEACAGKAAAPPPHRHALGLCHVHGPCTRDGSSWVNQPEVLQVIEMIKEIHSQWPETWGTVNLSSICVVSHGSQVKLLRQELRKIKYSKVTITNYENIIGGQFRVIIVSTVRSMDSLPSHPQTSSSFSLDIFCDPRVLNTVLTRARSQVVVVGDMVALCSFGGCNRIWRRYVRECVEAGSATPPGLCVEEIKQAVCDLQVWNEQSEEEVEEDDSDSWTSDPDINSEDSILQELLDNQRSACVTVSEEGMLRVHQETPSESSKNTYIDFPRHKLEQYLLIQPNIYKKCLFFKETFDSGYALTLNDCPPRRIKIKGRVNCGMGFSGDEVLIKLLPDTRPEMGMVVGVFQAGEDNRQFVCFMDPHDNSIMIPIDRSVTKIFCPPCKANPGRVPIRSYHNGHVKTLKFEKLTQEIRQNRLFLVQITRWHEGFYYPLGIVNRILPTINTLEVGLDILDLEYRVDSHKKYPVNAAKEATKIQMDPQIEVGLQDLRNIITFTVDPAYAKDLDDAISVRELDCYYEIGIHITDLASLVPVRGELDTEAKKRGVTFYPPKREAFHMLPPQLSSDRCSLKQGCDRQALSLIVLVEKENDRIVKGQFCRTVIRSDRQLTYEQANTILRDHRGKPLAFSNVEDCVATAGYFSRVHRVFRLQEAAVYQQPDEDRPPGDRFAQRMIEELMIMYNSWVAEFLTAKDSLTHLVPVRCQAHPSLQKIEEIRKKYSHILPLSNYLSHHLLDVSEPPIPSPGQQITMLKSVWEQLEDSARNEEYASVTDIFSADDLHPELCQVTREFRRQLGRSRFSRASAADANGHYSLQLCSYTWASSPLRRYLDIVVQRLLHGALFGNCPNISALDIDLLCHHFEKRVQQENAYEKKALALMLAMGLHEEVQYKLGVVTSVNPNHRGLQIVFPMNSDSLPDAVLLEFSALQPGQQPEPMPNGIRLSWRRRVYSFESFRDRPSRRYSRSDITAFSAKAWQEAVLAVRQGKPKQILSILKDGVEAPDPRSHVMQSSCGHYMEVTLELRPGDSLPVQLCTTIMRGLPTPIPQLCFPAPGIELCIEHSDRPVDCFSSLANRGPLQHYVNPRAYQQIWSPLCAIEAVVSAVSEGGSVLLTDVPLTWSKKDQTRPVVGQSGSFTLSAQIIKECDLDMDLSNCYLCLRLEGLRVRSSKPPLDSNTYTWVVHGLTVGYNSVEEQEGGTVYFHLHQSTMQSIPAEVFRADSLFTVEIIPKLLPDIRKEIALDHLPRASELCKNIILGKRVPDTEINRKLRSQTSFNIPGFRPLNSSQSTAVLRALTQPFTLIQGPPGTGKTVVGVHVVYWFHQMNTNPEEEETEETEETEESPGRRVLMYCGPSNKSVDVVAEMLLPLREKLRPLRVYSEQMELAEFPYPGSSRRISGYMREGTPNPALRPITLHHLIRQPSNSYHNKIRLMDRRIQNGEDITPDEVSDYKRLLYDARAEELNRHDVILCTCIAASNASLVRLPVTQLVIDECGMCTEPETLVPLVSHKDVQSVVLIGDHRQLRPVVKHQLCRTLKVDRSLFERYQERALMLDIQYRMHPAICSFPSMEFYDGRLRTFEQLRLQPSLFFHPRRACCPVVFGEVDGEEQSLMVTSEEGNLNSKANLVEAKQAVRLVRSLIQAHVAPPDIAVLTPYNAQVSQVTKMLQEEKLSGVTVCTIMKSQGSEWRYVIFSTVRAAPLQELDTRPTFAWLRQHLGFLGDPNQMNVALTRAKEGMCVLGNSNLLECCALWRRLLRHYQMSGAVVHSTLIEVTRRPRP